MRFVPSCGLPFAKVPESHPNVPEKVVDGDVSLSNGHPQVVPRDGADEF